MSPTLAFFSFLGFSLLLLIGLGISALVSTRSQTRRKDIRALKDRVHLADQTIRSIRKELNLQITAGVVDPFPLQIILTDYELDLEKIDTRRGLRTK